MGKTVKMSFEGKSQQEPRNWQMDRILIILKKRKRPKGFICPCTGVKYHNIQTCLLVYAADSGERLQDHWSSGFRSGFQIIAQSKLGFDRTIRKYNPSSK